MAALESGHDLFGRDAVAGPEDGDPDARGDPFDQGPVGFTRVGLRRRASVHGQRRRAGILDEAREQRRVDLPDRSTPLAS